MLTNNLKYNTKLLRLRLFKAALLLSVFSFSGFSLQLHAAFSESYRTELVESRISKPHFSLDKINKKHSRIPLVSQQELSLMNYENLLKVMFKTYHDKILLRSASVKETHIKIPPSSSEYLNTPLAIS